MRFVSMTDKSGAKLTIEFGGQHEQRPMETIEVDEFIAVKSHRAKGKRLTTYEVAKLTFIEPEVAEDEEYEDDQELTDDMLLGDDEPMDDIVDVDDNNAVEPTEKEDAPVSGSQLNLF